jgi:hypothetical protein
MPSKHMAMPEVQRTTAVFSVGMCQEEQDTYYQAQLLWLHSGLPIRPEFIQAVLEIDATKCHDDLNI